MPTHVNGRPVKTGAWTQEEDDLLAQWQAELGNRCARKKTGGGGGSQGFFLIGFFLAHPPLLPPPLFPP